MPRNGFFSFSGTSIQSISRRTISSSSLALCGPPKMTAPLWASSVSGSSSPNRGRRTSSGMPRLRSWIATRPGVESSPCRTIRIGGRIGQKAHGVKSSCRKSRQSACQSSPIRLMRDCKTAVARRSCRRFRAGLRGLSCRRIELRQQDAARHESRHERRHQPVDKARHHHPLAAHQPAIAGFGHALGRHRQRPRRRRLRRCRRGPEIRSRPDPDKGRSRGCRAAQARRAAPR